MSWAWTPVTKMPDVIWAWPLHPDKQDELWQGGWSMFEDRREHKFLAATPMRDAAPDLYAALEAAVEYMGFNATDSSQPYSLERCRAALAKARGEAK